MNQITVTNSVFAYNEARNAGNDWNITHTTSNQMLDGGNNIQDNNRATSANFLTTVTPTTQVADPLLMPLADNGGRSQTMALGASSPAIDAGNNSAINTHMFDQRGPGFNRIRNGTVDMGAFESAP